ncbi:MAG: hypothetical protein ACREJ8_09505 [Candidatus Methylomirabilales bacterium]
MTNAAPTSAHPQVLATESLWLRDKRWDLTFISFSVVLVAFPIITYIFANQFIPQINQLLRTIGSSFIWDDDASRNLVNGLIAIFIGGPHMYATFTRTAFDEEFTRRHKLVMGLSVLIPVGVVYFGVTHFQLLLTFLFFWASVHILHSIVLIMECYDKKLRRSLTRRTRMIDYAVIFSSLFPIATYKFVRGEFAIGTNVIYFPEFLKVSAVFYLVTAAFAVALLLFIAKTIREMREGVANYPKILLMSLTIVVSFFIPAFRNLDVAFQGFNTWHSFQYLGLTYYINRIRHEKGEISNAFVDRISQEGKGWQYYFLNIGFTVLAIGLILVLLMFRETLGLSFDQCYYIVVLSFLLMHYLHDHVLFTQPEAILLKQPHSPD